MLFIGRRIRHIAVLTVLLGTSLMSADEPAAKKAEETPAEQLHELFESQWQRQMQESPTWASHLGDLRYNTRWRDLSLKAIEGRHHLDRMALDRLREIDVKQLSDEDKLNYRLFERELEVQIEGHKYRWYLIPLNQRSGIQDANSLADALRFETLKDYEDWLARMRGLRLSMRQTIALMQAGINTGIVHPRVVMERVPKQINKQIVDVPEDSPFYKPFRDISENISKDDQERLRAEAVAVIRDTIIPEYKRFGEFFDNKYLPACYSEVGAWQHPQGTDLYAFRTREFTTTDLSPAEVHEIGLQEVARIRKLMEGIVREVKYDGTFAEFLTYLREDPQFYYDNPNDLMAAYQDFCKQVDPLLPKLFKRLPRTRYSIEAIPMQLAPDTTTGYYRQPSADGRRPGTYFVNLYRPEVRPKYEIPALSLHEAVPGHHLQIAFSMELDGLPPFRKYGGYTAFVEGWALYSEKLGEELDLYKTPYTRFGQLTYEMWRAVRLVVDTGIHSKKWTRQQAIDFFQANTAKTLLDIENEVDRYIAWPGQALAYKMGELKIRELRKRAEDALGEKFDIREFHDVVLRQGAVPLSILETLIDEWIDQTLKSR